MSSRADEETFPAMHYSLDSYIDQQPVSPPESYPVPGAEPDGESDMPYIYDSLSAERKKEFLEITRNSLEVLSGLLNSTSELKRAEEDLTISMLDKCKESQPVIQRIVHSTTDDEGLLFEALNLNDELQKVISKFDKMHVSTESNLQICNNLRSLVNLVLLMPSCLMELKLHTWMTRQKPLLKVTPILKVQIFLRMMDPNQMVRRRIFKLSLKITPNLVLTGPQNAAKKSRSTKQRRGRLFALPLSLSLSHTQRHTHTFPFLPLASECGGLADC